MGHDLLDPWWQMLRIIELRIKKLVARAGRSRCLVGLPWY
jgi:hypothetical protein